MMKWFKRFLVVMTLLVALAVTLIYLTPLDAYIPKVQQILGEQLHDPVKIQHIKIGVLPVPHLVLEGIQVGEPAGITLQSLKVVLDIRSLFESQQVIHRITLENGSVTLAQMEKLPALLHGEVTAPRKLRVEELQFSGIRALLPNLMLEPLEGKLEFASDSSLTRAWFALSGKKLTATLRPQPGSTFAVEVEAHAWSPPNYPVVVFNRLSVNGILTGTQFDAKKFSADAYGAHAEGVALLEWQPKWELVLRLDTVDAQLERLLSRPDKRVAVTGRLHGKGQVTTHGVVLSELSQNLKVDADVEIKNATLRVPASSQRAMASDAIKTHFSGTLAECTLSNLSVDLYGGVLSGAAVINNTDALVRADLLFNNIALQPLVAALNDEVKLTGTLDGNAKLAVRMREFANYPQNLQMDGAFRINNGVLDKVDLVQAASNPLKEGEKGGTTRFNELSGLLSVDANGYHFRKLKVSSGVLNAVGKLDISPQQQLNGLLDTELKGTATLISMPLVVSGSVHDPLLRPTNSALAGATVGTALLGPGVGTALGVKASNVLRKLFGKKDTKQDEKNEAIPKK